jgi:hypothetical protein
MGVETQCTYRKVMMMMTKKLWLFAVVLFAAAGAAFAQNAGDFTTEPDGAGMVITGYTGTGGDVAVPAVIGGSPVTAIDSDAFAECTSLSSVTIPASVTSIGTEAFFGCTSLSSVTIPASVTFIGEGAFAGCLSLRAIGAAAENRNYKDIDGVLFTKDGTTILAYPAGKGQSAYAIPAGVTVIGAGAFFGCTSLNSVTIPATVTVIGEWAFAECENLSSVTIPASVREIGEGAFYGCNSLPSETVTKIRGQFGESPFLEPQW